MYAQNDVQLLSKEKELLWTERAMGAKVCKGKLAKHAGTYFGSEDYVFTLLGPQPTADVIVSETLGVSIGGNGVPEHIYSYYPGKHIAELSKAAIPPDSELSKPRQHPWT